MYACGVSGGACLQEASVAHLRGDQMRLVAICLLHNALDIGGIQDLVKVELADVLREPLLKHQQDLLATALAPIH